MAFELLTAAERDGLLDGHDLSRLASAAVLTGRHDDAFRAWERAHHALLDSGEAAAAVRVAFWLAISLRQVGQHGPAGGWIGRAGRVLDESGLDVVERAYLLTPVALQHLGRDPERSLEIFREVTVVADRFGDPDGMALGRLGQGQALVALGRPAEGLPMLDQAMVEVTTADVSPIAAGIVYCAVIISCQAACDWRRAHEWTAALSGWCSGQSGLQSYQGQCLVHRSEMMQLRGDWTAALAEVQQAVKHLARVPSDPVMGMARYQHAELLRLRGQFEQAEEAYRQAGEWSHRIQPGLALLRLAQGRADDALAAIRLVTEEAEGNRTRRARLLAAQAEILLAAGEVAQAAETTVELDEMAADFDTLYLHAVAAASRGAVALADGRPSDALVALRRSWRLWRELEAPFEAARVMLQLTRAYRQLGDHDTAEMELDAARRVFEELGASPALAEAAELATSSRQATPIPGNLTPREVEVLRLVATGATNQGIADTLVISEKTVARHLSNLFTKLGISSRAAATAWAYEHGMI